LQLRARGKGELTWEDKGGPGGNVDLLQMLQCLGVEEADGGARGKGHPDPAARLDHVRDAGLRVRVGLEGLLPKGELQKGHQRVAP